MECENFFSLEECGDILIVTPQRNLGELDLLGMKDSCNHIGERFKSSNSKHVVLDLGTIDFFGSSALSLFIQLWTKVSETGGKMAVCNASSNERAILHHTRLDTIWPIFETKDDAIEAVHAG